MPVASVLEEMRSQPNILQLVKDGNIDADAYPLSIQLLKEFRGSQEFGALVAAKMSLGSEPMKDIGNVYCAALPAWMAAGLEDAYAARRRSRGPQGARRRLRQRRCRRGDSDDGCAAGWRDAAAKIGFEAALEPHQDLTQQQYETLHDTGTAQGLRDPEEGFVIQSIGSSANPKFSDEGIEYYRFVR